MDEDREFYSLHLPYLIGYVVPVLQSKKGDVELGSGVLVKVNGRHFVATAKHCIDADVRLIRSYDPTQRVGTVGTRPIQIIARGWHDTLDLGYLEIENPECAELNWDQLCYDRIVGGMVQVVGYPIALVETNRVVPGKVTEISLAAGTFGTTLKEEDDDKITFDYPKIGMRYNIVTGTWYESPFPETPKGFSGGACFGVVKPPGPIAQVQYKLLAIQYEWNKRDSVFAVPISRWCELLIERGLAS
jgi:hypothetical protein